VSATVEATGRIGIVEDDEHLRAYLEGIIADTPGMEVAFSEGTVAGAKRCCADGLPDPGPLDPDLPAADRFHVVRPIQAARVGKRPTQRSGRGNCRLVTVLRDRARRAIPLQAGADGHLLKDTPPQVLAASIRSTLQGDTPISPQAARFLLEMYKATSRTLVEGTAESSLTAREVDVLKLFSRGLSYRETATALAISQNTIRDHVKAIYRKLSVHSRTEAIFEARQLGVISPLD